MEQPREHHRGRIKMKRTRLKLLFVIGGILLLMTFLFFRASHSDSQPQDVHRAGEDVKEVKQSNPSANMPAISSTNSVIVSQLIEKDAALECLKRWIKRREGKDVKIVDAQEILDLQGKPTCVNVLVTTRLEGLDVETLKQQLDANAVREHELRGELQKAYQRVFRK
jgi:cell division protein YceG involved in septum cleavage